jgi:hypothetical protein
MRNKGRIKMTIYIIIAIVLVAGFMANRANSRIREHVKSETVKLEAGVKTPIILTENGEKLKGYLYDTPQAKEFMTLLPMTVSMSYWGHDFCGGKFSLKYDKNDEITGYNNGNIVYWTPKNQLALFVGGDNNHLLFMYTHNVILGKLDESQERMDNLKGSFDITVDLVRNNN